MTTSKHDLADGSSAIPPRGHGEEEPGDRCRGSSPLSPEAAQTAQCRSGLSRLDAALFAATLLMCAVALSPNVADPDLWGHVQYGRDALRDGLPATTTHSFTAADFPWINHENIAELLLAVGADTVGPSGLLLCKSLLGVGLMLLVIGNARRRHTAMLSRCLTALLVAINLTYFWTMRPQVLSFVWYALLLTLLSWCFAGWEGECRIAWLRRLQNPEGGVSPLAWSPRRLRLLWLAPILFALWTNSHGGFVAGWCIWTAYLGGRAVEAWCARGRAALSVIAQFGALAACSAAATLVNPYGVGLHRWLLDDLLPPRPEILEWRSPEMLSLTMLPFWLILVTFVSALLLTRRSRDVTHLAILGLTAWQSFLHARHIPFFAIAFGFWMVVHVDSVLRRFHLDFSALGPLRLRPSLRRACVAVVTLVYLLLGVQLANRVRQLTVERNEYPVAAFQYIADQRLRGRMVVTFNWAQYAIEALGAKRHGERAIQVSFDGRYRTSYSQDVADMNFDFILGALEPRYRAPSTPFHDHRVLDFGAPDLVLISRYQPHSVNVMFRNRGQWTLLYQDKIAQLWGRAAVYDDPNHATYVPPTRRRISESPQAGLVAWPAHPRKSLVASNR